jgi:hypothetical protein
MQQTGGVVTTVARRNGRSNARPQLMCDVRQWRGNGNEGRMKATDEDDQLDDEAADEWEEFRGEAEPVRTEDLKRLNLAEMPEGIHVWVMDDYFPDAIVWRDGESLV